MAIDVRRGSDNILGTNVDSENRADDKKINNNENGKKHSKNFQ